MNGIQITPVDRNAAVPAVEVRPETAGTAAFLLLTNCIP
jgi:hypothetical protein